MKKILILALAMSVMSVAAQAAGDPEAGKTKSAVCAACHNVNGISIVPIYPNLAGQKLDYLISSLKAYRAGERKGGQSAVMVPMAANLSDQDIEDLAAYYSSLPPGGGS